MPKFGNRDIHAQGLFKDLSEEIRAGLQHAADDGYIPLDKEIFIFYHPDPEDIQLGYARSYSWVTADTDPKTYTRL